MDSKQEVQTEGQEKEAEAREVTPGKAEVVTTSEDVSDEFDIIFAGDEEVSESEIDSIMKEIETPEGDEDEILDLEDFIFNACVVAIKEPELFNATTFRQLLKTSELDEIWDEAEEFVKEGGDDVYVEGEEEGEEELEDDPEPEEME